HPIQFVSAGETTEDAENLQRIRDDWRERNGGIGLKDVRQVRITIIDHYSYLILTKMHPYK
ncbi:hypothetical protein BJV82DRAFT_510410, partial [Fennellomyces sp. T-0311]